MNGTKPISKKNVELSDLNNYVFYLLQNMDYTENKIRTKLKDRFPLQPELHEDCIAKIYSLGLINDDKFALRFFLVQARAKDGIQKIRQKMIAKGFTSETINDTLNSDEVANFDFLRNAISLRVKFYGTEPFTDRKKRDKASRKLLGKGFSFDIIGKALNYNFEEDELELGFTDSNY